MSRPDVQTEYTVAELRANLGVALDVAHYTDCVVAVGKRERPHASIVSPSAGNLINFLLGKPYDQELLAGCVSKLNPENIAVLGDMVPKNLEPQSLSHQPKPSFLAKMLDPENPITKGGLSGALSRF